MASQAMAALYKMVLCRPFSHAFACDSYSKALRDSCGRWFALKGCCGCCHWILRPLSACVLTAPSGPSVLLLRPHRRTGYVHRCTSLDEHSAGRTLNRLERERRHGLRPLQLRAGTVGHLRRRRRRRRRSVAGPPRVSLAGGAAARRDDNENRATFEVSCPMVVWASWACSFR